MECMRRTSFHYFHCPAARALESVGDWWSMLILREAFYGLTCFEQFQQSLGISPNILSRRMKHLTNEGLFEKRQYLQRPVRYEYRLTSKGRDFYPVFVTLFAWSNRHLPEDQIAMRLGDSSTGEEQIALVIDAKTGGTITIENTVLLPGPAATEETFKRIRAVRAISLRADDVQD